MNKESRIGVVGRYFNKIVKDDKIEYLYDPKCYFTHADYKKVFLIEYNKSIEPVEFKPVPKSASEK